MSNLGNKEVMARNIKFQMDSNNVDRIKLSNDLKIKYTTLSDWINAKTYPRIDKIELLANYFGISKAELVEDEIKNDISIIYNQLDDDRKEKVYTYAESELKAQHIKEDKVVYVDFNKEDLTEVNAAYGVSAGVGYENDYELSELTTFYTDENLRNYDFALIVNGDSMKPKFNDGDIILLQETGEPDNGSIYAVINDESFYVKQITVEDDKFIMHSLNKKYGDITIGLGEGIEPPRIIGKVVDSFTPLQVN